MVNVWNMLGTTKEEAKMTRVKWALGFAALTSAMLAVPATADVKTGVDAWSKGDYATAVAEWRGPAGQGDADAQFNLAQAYRLGRGVEANIDLARDLYLRASDQGHLKAADNYGLLLFQQGSRKEAIPYITAASDRGDPRAQYVLGLAHFNADHAVKDWVRAYALLTLANSTGLPQASGAITQMDQFIPYEQRQEAQVLAQKLKQESDARRASQLATIALGTSGSAGTGVSGSGIPRPLPSTPVAPSRPTGTTVASLPNPVPFPSPAVTRPTTNPVTRPAPSAPALAATGGSWKVQLGAFGVRSNADQLWSKLSKKSALSGAKKLTIPSGRVTRLLAGGFASRAEANRACSRLKAGGQDCLVTSR